MQPNIILVQLQPKLIVSIYDKYLKQSKKFWLCNMAIYTFHDTFKTWTQDWEKIWKLKVKGVDSLRHVFLSSVNDCLIVDRTE